MATYNGVVTGGGLNLRQTASTSSLRIIQIPDGTAITVSTITGKQEWFSTSYNGYSGYVVAQYVAITEDGDTCTVSTSSGSLNIRKTASTSADVVFTAAKGATLRLLDTTSVSGWYRVSNASGTGWGSSAYLTLDNDSCTDDSSGNGDSALNGTETYGTIRCDNYVNIRSSYSTSSDVIGRLFNGDPVVYYAGESYSNGDYTWYRIRFDGDAYIASNYVTSNTDDHTVTHTLVYNADAAVEYAYNHTDNDEASNYHTAFGKNSSDCANFVNQCLCAGGLPMFKGWSDSLTGIPSTWSDDNWQLTNASRCPLIVKGRISAIPHTAVKKGDIIYTYDSDADVHLCYPHVVIAATDYDSSTGQCRVHGHTTNQRYALKALTASTCRCYHVTSSIKVEACEKRISLPVSGSTYEILG